MAAAPAAGASAEAANAYVSDAKAGPTTLERRRLQFRGGDDAGGRRNRHCGHAVSVQNLTLSSLIKNFFFFLKGGGGGGGGGGGEKKKKILGTSVVPARRH